MARSPPPAAINSSMTPVTASTTAGSQSTDLPLRDYPCDSSSATEPNPNDVHQPASHPPTGLAARLPPETPSSVAAEYGDATNTAVPSAAIITEGIIRSYGRSQPRSRAASQNHGTARPPRSSTPTPARSPSADTGRSRSLQRRELSPITQALNDKVQRFLNSMNPISATEELMKENRSLHQRIAALQLTERDLLNDNQELARRLASTQKRQDARRQKWKEELLNRESVFEARIKDLEARLARQEEELLRAAIDWSRETALSDNNISTWFATKANLWREWVDDFAHRDKNRVPSGLHPLQLRELCEGVKHFVRLTEEGDLPNDLFTSSDHGGLHTAQALLLGLLANFIVSETLESPFWVFDVISPSTMELESPSVPRLNSMSPVGFRMDLAMWNFNVAPPRDFRPPQPKTTANGRPSDSQDIRKLPRLVTSIQPAGNSSDTGRGVLDQKLPSRQAMEGFYRVLLNVQGGNVNANAWRSSVMKAFCEGGMSVDVDNMLLTEEARVLAEARLIYAGRLKDRFLRGPARFLLQDQDAVGIDKLERRLVQEIDAALRFSCQLWCRRDTPWVKGLPDLADTTLKTAGDDMELEKAQTSLFSRPSEGGLGLESASSNSPNDCAVIMVVQPAIGVSMSPGRLGKRAKVSTRVWAKASVLVTTPKNLSGSAPAQDMPPHSLALVKPSFKTLPSAGGPTVVPEDRPDAASLLLPKIAFEGAARSLTKQSPSLIVPLVGTVQAS